MNESYPEARSDLATQPREQDQGVISRAQEQVQETTEQARAQAGDRLREEVDRRSTTIGDQGQSFAEALRRAAADLDTEGKEVPARVAHSMADTVERVSTYLRDVDADRLLGDAEGQARRRPWAAAGTAALLGFLASRFVKASSAQRYERRTHGRYGGRQVRALPPTPLEAGDPGAA